VAPYVYGDRKTHAAHDVLLALFPSARPTLDAALATRLKSISAGSARDGMEVGRQVAQAVLRWRQGDGWPASISPDAAFPLAQLPGFWAPTPPANSNPLFTFLTAQRHPSVHRLPSARRPAGVEPRSRRHPFPVRFGGEPDGVSARRRARTRHVHATERTPGHADLDAARAIALAEGAFRGVKPQRSEHAAQAICSRAQLQRRSGRQRAFE
jgi:hypothetical protein